jgi:NADH:ubiquinone oxidoreductase subunit 6 (subunit J)
MSRYRPFLVLGVAIVLPGMGHVLNRTPVRGLLFLFYIILLGTITYHLTTPDHSFLGRYAGGIFVYAISIMDAYRTAAAQALTRSSGGSR